MKLLGEKSALNRLLKLKTDFQEFVRENYEHKAKDCLTCEVQGDCCTDAHFVNVHITRLEAVAIQKAISELENTDEVFERVEKTIEEYDLNGSENSFNKTFACPLFEKGTGCLVHKKGKPIPCIQHACYENESDLPPDKVQLKQEKAVERLNTQTYGNAWNWLLLPVWIRKITTEHTEQNENIKKGGSLDSQSIKIF